MDIPPLRERREDIIPLAMFIISDVSDRFNKKTAGFSPEVLNFFEEYHWPGNVRQLVHEIERLVALTPEGEQISMINCCPQELKNRRNASSITDIKNQQAFSLPAKVKEVEIGYINDALLETRGNKVQASKLLGITRQGLNKKIKRYNISNSAKTMK